MHFYLRLVNKSGDPIVEQSFEAGFHSEEVGLESGSFPDVSNNPDTQASPGAFNHFLVFYFFSRTGFKARVSLRRKEVFVTKRC
jgi:hypothetical protein